MNVSLVNATPLPLSLTLFYSNSSEKCDLDALEEKSASFPDGPVEADSVISLQVRDKTMPSLIGRLQFGATVPRRVIVPADLRSPGGQGQLLSVTFVNHTRFYVQIYRVDNSGSEQVAGRMLGPGDPFSEKYYPGHLFLAKRIFTREILAMFVVGNKPEQTLAVTEMFLEAKAEKMPLQSPLLPEIKKVRLVGEATSRNSRNRTRDHATISLERNLRPPPKTFFPPKTLIRERMSPRERSRLPEWSWCGTSSTIVMG